MSIRHFLPTALFALLAACHDNTPRSDVAVTTDGAETHLRYGKAFPKLDGLVVVLSGEETTCDPPKGPGVQIELSPGPDGRFYAGALAAQGVDINLVAKDDFSIPNRAQTVTLEPVQAEVGKRVRGIIAAEGKSNLHAYTIRGSFDVEICEGNDPLRVAPMKAEAPPGPVSGTFAGKPVAFKSAAIELGSVYGEVFVMSFVLSPEEQASCRPDFRTRPGVLLVSPGGTSAKTPVAGTVQPAFADMLPGGPLGGRLRPAWVKFDALTLKEGTTATGEIIAESAPGAPPERSGAVGGHFSAIVCPRVDPI